MRPSRKLLKEEQLLSQRFVKKWVIRNCNSKSLDCKALVGWTESRMVNRRADKINPELVIALVLVPLKQNNASFVAHLLPS